MPVEFNLDFDNPEIDKSFKRVAWVQRTFVREVSNQNEEMEKEKKSYNSYFADSWDSQIATQRKSAGLPVSDVARFSSVVDTISGAERQDRTDISIFPFEADDQLVADVGNIYLKYRNRKELQWHEDSLTFINAIVSKRAHNEFFLRNNPKDGSLETVRVQRPASEVFVQKPFRDIAARDSRGTIHAQWVHIDDLKRQYGNRIPVELLDMTPQDRQPRHEITHLLDAYDFPDKEQDSQFFRREKNMVRVIRWWRKYLKNIYRVLNPSPNSFEEIIISTENSRQKAIESAVNFLSDNPELAINILQNNVIEIDGNRVEEATNRNIEIIAERMLQEETQDFYAFHKISGRVELEYEENWGDFLPWTHMFCYFVDGKAGGLHDRIKDLIEEVNFIHAKLMQRLGTMGKMPLGLEQSATEMEEDAIKQAYQDGGVIWLKDGAIRGGQIFPFEDKTLSSIPAYLTLEESLNNTMKELTGANDPLQGRSPGANTAGIAIELLQRKGSALIAPILDNYKRFKMENARMEINMLLRAHFIRPNWTSMKLVKIVGGLVGDRESQLATQLQDADGTTPDGDDTGQRVLINEILQRMNTMEYDFTFDEFINSPTLRMAQLQTLAQVSALIGFPLDPRIIIEDTELPQKKKDQLIAFLSSVEGAQQLASRGAQGGENAQGSLRNVENTNAG